MQNSIQNQIGSDSIFRGFIGKGWTEIQKTYLQEKGLPRNKNQAENGLKELTKSFMLYARHRWDLRNNRAHNTILNKDSYKHTRLILELKHLQDQRDAMLLEDRVLIDSQPVNLTSMKTYQLQRLIRTIAPIVKQSKREAKKLGKRQRRITSYFRTKKRRLHTLTHFFRAYPPPERLSAPRPPPEPDPGHSEPI